MGRPREHDDATRQALLAAAERLVDDEGPDALSIRAVADAVGTTTRAVYSLFGSKQGLLEALAIRLFEELSRAMDAVPRTDDPAADLVEAGIAGFRGTALTHPSLYRLVFLRVVPDLQLGADFAEVASGAFARLESLVARIEPAADPTTMHERALAFHALTEGLASMEIRGTMIEPASADRVWHDALTTFAIGFAAVSAIGVAREAGVLPGA